MEAELELVPAKCGCEGCFYEDADKCPGEDKPRLSACTDLEGRGAMIFKRKENKDE